jgi:hypothetical protein
VVTKQLLAYLNGRAAYVRPFFREIVVTAEKNEQNIIEGDYAAKIVASIIIAGILLMFSYGLLHWIFFE